MQCGQLGPWLYEPFSEETGGPWVQPDFSQTKKESKSLRWGVWGWQAVPYVQPRRCSTATLPQVAVRTKAAAGTEAAAVAHLQHEVVAAALDRQSRQVVVPLKLREVALSVAPEVLTPWALLHLQAASSAGPTSS